MKRVVGVAALAALLCVAGWGGWNLTAGLRAQPGQTARPPEISGTASAATSEPTAPAHSLVVPALDDATRPVPLQLTESMLRNAVEAGTLLVTHPGGERYPVRSLRGREEPAGRWSVIGTVATRLGPQSMILTFGGHDVFGVLPLPDGSQLTISTTRRVTGIAPAGGMIPPGHSSAGSTDMLLPPKRPKSRVGMPHALAAPALAAAADAGTEVTIDLLGLYSDNLVTLRGSVEAAETEVINQVAVANQSHVDSDTHVRFALKGMKQVQVDPEIYNTPLVESMLDEQMEEALRDELGADLVFLLRPHVEGDGSCGVAWLNGDNLGTEFDPAYGYSVINVGPCSPWVLPHELGHNMGSSHDRETATASDGSVTYGAFPWSFGFRRGGDAGFATIMAYSDYDKPRIGYFSDPGSMACGEPCGADGLADNVRSLKAMAPAIAAFRGTPGTVSLADAARVEPVGGDTTTIGVPIRLSGAAPEGGLRFRVDVTGGTASAGLDFALDGSSEVELAAGEREVLFPVTIIGDDDEEGDETVTLELVALDDTTIEDGNAVMTIVDDDPRTLVRGRAVFPEGTDPPETGFQMLFQGIDGIADSNLWIDVGPPDFSYSVPVARNSVVRFSAFLLPEPFVSAPVKLGLVDSTVEANLPLEIGMRVSGTIMLPEGGTEIDGNFNFSVEEALEGVGPIASHNFGLSPGDTYSVLVMPGAIVNIEATPPAPYQPYWFRMPRMQGDLEHDVVLSTQPSLVVWGGEFSHEYETTASVIALSAPAPAGGVTVTYSNHSGTAVAGEDFAPADHVALTIPEGSKGINFDLGLLHDNRYEPTEYFKVAVDEVQGATPTVPAMRVVIEDNDAHTGGPAQKQRAP